MKVSIERLVLIAKRTMITPVLDLTRLSIFHVRAEIYRARVLILCTSVSYLRSCRRTVSATVRVRLFD